jgi:predicted nucleotide-binding protein (sugar kinase/HSP70/actin superfamily)
MAVWSDVAQRALRDVAELSARTTQESVRQYTECQQMNMDLLREAQAAMFQRIFHATRRNAETMMEACQRLEHTSEDATRSLGETFREASSRMQDVYARSDRLRAA